MWILLIILFLALIVATSFFAMAIMEVDRLAQLIKEQERKLNDLLKE